MEVKIGDITAEAVNAVKGAIQRGIEDAVTGWLGKQEITDPDIREILTKRLTERIFENGTRIFMIGMDPILMVEVAGGDRAAVQYGLLAPGVTVKVTNLMGLGPRERLRALQGYLHFAPWLDSLDGPQISDPPKGRA